MRKADAGAGAKKDGSGIRVIRWLPARLIRVLDHALFLVLNFSPIRTLCGRPRSRVAGVASPFAAERWSARRCR
jgi:hypothetical protein